MLLVWMVFVSPVTVLWAENVQYRLSDGKVTGITLASIPSVPGYGVLIGPTIPVLSGCSTPPPSALVVVGGTLTVRPTWGCLQGIYVHNRESLLRAVRQKLDAAFVVFEASQAGERTFAEVRAACPVTDVSAPCVTLRSTANQLRTDAQTLVGAQGW